MGSKKKGNTLGRCLIRDRFSNSHGRKFVAKNSMLHTTEVDDGYDWNRINLQSVTEQSTFEEFLSTAELADTDFQAEKLNIKFVNPNVGAGLPTESEIAQSRKAQVEYKSLMKIPRRPLWNEHTTPSELDAQERHNFLEWRRILSSLQDKDGLVLTPYEKNLEFWRQLWRVVERSDVVVQIVDARNPLLFRCEDLECYVKELSPHKVNMILINKADFLNQKQRQHWLNYFKNIGIKTAFFSSHTQEETTDESPSSLDMRHLDRELSELDENVEKDDESNILTREELINLFKRVHNGSKVTQNVTTVGLVGYPNVGKSSMINTLLTVKKVAVSATPGKTKHFQTLYLDKELLLCDCPGLVMPSFVHTKADMIVSGVLPIDQMRDHVPPVNLVCRLIPRYVLEDHYGIMLPPPAETEDSNRPPTSEELLNAYAFNRGYMTANGQPDNPRGSRYVLKDFLNGKLLYCHSPPDVDQDEYHQWPKRQRIINENRVLPPRQIRATKQINVTGQDVDRRFFNQSNANVHTKTRRNDQPKCDAASMNGLNPKPWKQYNKHVNKNRKEKLRRVYAHLDRH